MSDWIRRVFGGGQKTSTAPPRSSASASRSDDFAVLRDRVADPVLDACRQRGWGVSKVVIQPDDRTGVDTVIGFLVDSDFPWGERGSECLAIANQHLRSVGRYVGSGYKDAANYPAGR